MHTSLQRTGVALFAAGVLVGCMLAKTGGDADADALAQAPPRLTEGRRRTCTGMI